MAGDWEGNQQPVGMSRAGDLIVKLHRLPCGLPVPTWREPLRWRRWDGCPPRVVTLPFASLAILRRFISFHIVLPLLLGALFGGDPFTRRKHRSSATGASIMSFSTNGGYVQ